MERFVLYRRPNRADLDTMYSILESSLSSFLYINKTSSQDNQLLLDKKYVQEYLEDERYFCLVAESEKKIVGWVAGSNDSIILRSHVCNNGDFYIEEIAVKESERGKGIGKSLLDKIGCFNIKRIVVDVILKNEVAIKFYKSTGFFEYRSPTTDSTKNWIRMFKECNSSLYKRSA